MIVTVTLPWPPKGLSPNARKHWRAKSPISKGYRHMARMLTLEALGRRQFATVPLVQIAFAPPDDRRRDDDNLVASFKAARDGIADAIRHDDHLWRPTYTFLPPHRPDGQVVVTLTEAA